MAQIKLSRPLLYFYNELLERIERILIGYSIGKILDIVLPRIHSHLKWIISDLFSYLLHLPNWLQHFLLHLADYRCMRGAWRDIGITFRFVNRGMFHDLQLLTIECNQGWRSPDRIEVLRCRLARIKGAGLRSLWRLLFENVLHLKGIKRHIVMLLTGENDGWWDSELFHSEVWASLGRRVIESARKQKIEGF